MAKLQSMIGQRFGQLVVIAESGWVKCTARCDCGVVKEFYRSNLRQGYSTKCHRNPPDAIRGKLLVVWSAMKARCFNKNHPNYDRYGGRGIKVCKQWLDFENFISDMGPVPEGMELERKDNNKGYSPDNCIWATRHAQMRNTQRNIQLNFQGRTQTAIEWASELGINRSTLYARLNRSKWSVERALTTI